MKALKPIVAASLLSLAFAAQAGPRHDYDDRYGYDDRHGDGRHGHTDWAKVTRVTPQYERVNHPRRECHTDYVTGHRRVDYGDDRSYGGAVIGGIAGGIIGNQVGKGSGRAAATGVGAVVGAIVGDRIDNSGYREAHYERHRRPVERCAVVDHWEKRLTGYLVEYKYRGRHYTRVMDKHPGRRIPVRVAVRPY